MLMVTDAGVLFIKTLSDSFPLGVDLAFESDGLTRRTKHSFA